jgi:phosphate transport system permease protein
MRLDTRRRLQNRVALSLSVLATGFGLFFLAAIIFTLLWNGLQGITPALFLLETPAPGNPGGLSNAIFGSVVMTLIAIVIATPIGILAGTYLSESGRGSRIAEAAKFINDVLLSAPSIIVGLFVYALIVVPTGHFSAWAGALALAVIALPVINRTTQDMLALVPSALREAAAALGTPYWKIMVHVIFRAARNGILTGVLLAFARISGETAPLLFTALSNQYFTADMSKPMASLPVVIFQFAMSPYDDWHALAWGGALLITLTILVLNILARLLTGGRRST